MNILKKFTLQNLKLNKKRTIVTIIGIMLSTALVCAVSGMVSSTQKTLVNLMKESDGDFHVCFEEVPKEQLKYVENNVDVESYFLSANLGYAKLDDSYNPDKPYAYVMEFDKSALEKSALKLEEGRMPENNDEILIPRHLIENGRINIKVGDTITLDIGTRQLTDGSKLTQSNPYLAEDTLAGETAIEDIPTEEIVDTKTKIYTVVGIIERPSYNLEYYSAPGYTLISYMENTDNIEKANISVTYKNVNKYEDSTKKITEVLKNNIGESPKLVYNTDVIRFEGGLSEATLRVLYEIAGVVIVIIVVSSVFVIRNSFSISVSEKTKQYGMLSSVGATKKQIRKTVLLEGFYIGVIAIPLGIVCGIIAIIVLLWIVNLLLGDILQGSKFIYSVPALPILISVIISSITIYLSCIIPARRASKIPPIEAIRGNADIKIKAKKLKTSKLTKKIFGIGGVIASKNLKRNKKKYRTTLISLVVSIAIFISLSSFLEYGKKMTNMYYTDIGYNIVVYGGTKELYEEIVKMNNVKDYSYAYLTAGKIDINKYGTDFGKKEYEEEKKYYKDEGSVTEYESSIQIVMINEKAFKKYIKELGLKEENSDKIAILGDDMLSYNEDGRKKLDNYYSVKEGEEIIITIKDKEKDIKISKKTDKRPMGYENTYTSGGWLFVSEKFDIEKNENMESMDTLKIDSSDATKLENELIDLKKEDERYSDISIYNYQEIADSERRIILLVSIFLYGFITVITLIGVTNIFNTITTNMILRSKEFANLKSVGMTGKEFNRMIRLESILYGMKSLLIGIPIGLLGSFAIYKSFANSIDLGYLIPWTSIIISIVFVFIIVGLTMKYSLNKINKQNIIETIRQDNI
ncbi:MAG: ABC transporter permease [Clostridia bacterium]